MKKVKKLNLMIEIILTKMENHLNQENVDFVTV